MAIRFQSARTGQAHVEADCFRQLNLLAHAQMSGIETGSECGGHGVCGKDRVQLSEASRARVSPITEIERRHLSESDRAQGVRLACQCFPERDGESLEAILINA